MPTASRVERCPESEAVAASRMVSWSDPNVSDGIATWRVAARSVSAPLDDAETARRIAALGEDVTASAGLIDMVAAALS